MRESNQISGRKSLLSRMFRGGAWLGAGSMVEQGLRFLRNMILARLLLPEAFGLMAIVLSVSHLLQVLTSVGGKEAIIQHPEGASRTYLNGTWWLLFARSLLLYLVAFASAPAISWFYEEAQLTALLRVGCLSILLSGAVSPRAFVALKQMKYGKWVAIQQGAGALGVLATLALALLIGGVWALVLGAVAESVLRVTLSFILCPFRPGFEFDREHWKALLSYARGIFGLPALMLVYSEGSVFALGKMADKHQLGLFAMALALSRIPGLIGKLLVDLLLPAFAEVQKDTARINRHLLQSTTAIVLVCMPMLAFVALYSRSILTLVYGPQYAEGADALTFLFANEMLMTCNIPLASVYYMCFGQPALLRKFSFLRAVLMVLFIVPAIQYFGLAGAALAPLCAMIISYYFQLRRMKSLTDLDVSGYSRVFLQGLLFSFPVALVGLLFKSVGLPALPWAELVPAGVACALFYAGFAFVAWRRGSWRQMLGRA